MQVSLIPGPFLWCYRQRRVHGSLVSSVTLWWEQYASVAGTTPILYALVYICDRKESTQPLGMSIHASSGDRGEHLQLQERAPTLQLQPPTGCATHELRNEVVEELIPHLVGESRAELDAPL